MATDANGRWIGYGLGDVSPIVEEMKVYLVTKFGSYAAPLQASVNEGHSAAMTYDQTMVDVVTQMQTRYGDNSAVNPYLVVNGVMGASWQIRCGFSKPPKVVLFTAQGTGVDMWNAGWPQPYAIALGIAAALPGKVTVQPVGNYPASVTGPPMAQSAEMGRVELKRLLGVGTGPGPVYASGPCGVIVYSQSAILGSHLWREDILPVGGDLHHRQNDVLFVITEGNPLRANGVAYGNDDAGWGPSPVKDGVITGGIAGPDCLTTEQTTKGIFYDYVWLGSDNGETELYTANPNGPGPAQAPAGNVGTLMYDAVTQQSFGTVIKVMKALGEPVGMAEEIYNGLTFALKGPNADHFAYDIAPMITLGVRKINAWLTAYVTSGGAITGSNPAA